MCGLEWVSGRLPLHPKQLGSVSSTCVTTGGAAAGPHVGSNGNLLLQLHHEKRTHHSSDTSTPRNSVMTDSESLLPNEGLMKIAGQENPASKQANSEMTVYESALWNASWLQHTFLAKKIEIRRMSTCIFNSQGSSKNLLWFFWLAWNDEAMQFKIDYFRPSDNTLLHKL